jgi:ricin-type beta-trefoil lectin protein
MYAGVDRQASYTSPLVMSGHLNVTRQGWTLVGFAAIQPPPPNPFTPRLPMVITSTMLKGPQGRCLVAVPQPLVGKPMKNSPVIEADCTGRPEARWRARGGNLVNEASGLCLSINNGRLAKGQGLLVWDCHGGPDQAWVLKDTQIVLGATGLCANGGGFKGTPVVTGSCDRTTATTWNAAN